MYGVVVICLGLAVVGPLIFTATPLSAAGRGLKRFFVAPPGSEQLVFVCGLHATGTLTAADPEPLATAMLVVREPWMKST